MVVAQHELSVVQMQETFGPHTYGDIINGSYPNGLQLLLSAWLRDCSKYEVLLEKSTLRKPQQSNRFVLRSSLSLDHRSVRLDGFLK